MMDFLRRCVTLVVAASVALTIGAAAAGAGLPTAAAALPGRTASTASVAGTAGTLTIDTQRRVDVNNLNMFVTNFGSWAYDLATGNPGLVSPRGPPRPAVFAGGVWFAPPVPAGPRAASVIPVHPHLPAV